MAFLHSVIGDNTIENREHLEKLGYKFINLSWDGKYIFTSNDKSEAYYANGSGFGHINCIGNPQLFKVVSAMRDDSDMDQYFVAHCFVDFFPMKGQSDRKTVSGGQLFLCKKENIKSIKAKWLSFHCVDVLWHKASISELQAHFQRV